MSQVQNTTLHNWIQPIALMALTYVAGSKRWIQHFPGASRGGLCLAAGLGVGVTLVSPHIQAPEVFKTNLENESAIRSLTRVTASLALGTFSAYAIAKSLKGRLSFCSHAAVKFMGLESLLTVVFMGISSTRNKSSSFLKKEEHAQTLEKKYISFVQNSYSWQVLCKQERSRLGREFYHAGFPVHSLEEGEWDTTFFEPVPDFSKLSKNQREWYLTLYLRCLDLNMESSFCANVAKQKEYIPLEWEMRIFNQFVSNLSGKDISTLVKEDVIFLWSYRKFLECINQCSEEQQVGLNTAFHKHEMQTVWIWPLTEAHVLAIQTIDGALEWVHMEFMQAPIAFGALNINVRTRLEELFRQKGMLIEDVESLLTKLSSQQIQSLSSDYAQDWKRFFEAYPIKFQELFGAVFKALDAHLTWFSNELAFESVGQQYVARVLNL